MDNAEATGPAFIALSRPDLTGRERELLLHAFDSNRIAPGGADIDAFEAEVAAICGRRHAVALTGHTTALHLALGLVGVRPGREVIVGALSDLAVLDAVILAGATPVVVDSEPHSWGPDPDLVLHALKQRASRGRRPAAVVASDVYGQCADHDTLEAICKRHGVPLVVDAADSLGAWRQHRPAGARGDVAVVAFDAERIATCGGGAVVLTDCDDAARRARTLTDSVESTDAPSPTGHRMPNLLATIGRGQLERLEQMIERRHAIRQRYVDWLRRLPAIGFMPVPHDSGPNCWLTVITLADSEEAANLAAAGSTPATFDSPDDHALARRTARGDGSQQRAALLQAFEAERIGARPTRVPLHRLPHLHDAERIITGVADDIARRGLCLPSGSALTDADVDRVIAVTTRVLSRTRTTTDESPLARPVPATAEAAATPHAVPALTP